MRVSMLLLGALSLGFGLSAASAFDFELKQLIIKDLDGDKIDLYFTHESNRVFYRPPPSWTWTGSAGRFETAPPPPRSGKLVIQTIKPVPEAGLPGDGDKVEEFKKLALGSLGSDAVAPEITDAQVTKLGGRALPTTRLTIAFQRNGQPHILTLSYVLFRPEIWLQMVIDAAKVDYDQSTAEALSSLEGFTEVPTPAPKPAAEAGAAPAPTGN